MAAAAGVGGAAEEQEQEQVDWVDSNVGLAPLEFYDPITGGVLQDPVVAEDGRLYSRSSIEAALQREAASPSTGEPMGPELSPAPPELLEALSAFRSQHGAVPPPPGGPRGNDEGDNDAGKEEEGAASSSSSSKKKEVASLRDLRMVFSRLDRLRDILATTLEGWCPPQVVVLGGESSGKSTLLARLTMMPLFPAHDELCTRLPIHVRLRHCSSVRPPRLEVCDAATGALLEGPWEVPMGSGHAKILEKMEELVWAEENQRLGVHTGRMLVVHVDSPAVPSLDLVDLPGLVQSPPAMAEATDTLVRRYIRQHDAHSIFLAVVPSAQKPNDAKALALVHQLAVADRTIGVLTMCDELPKRRHAQLRERVAGPPPDCGEGQMREWLAEPLAGDAVRLRNGYVATANEPMSVGDTGRAGQKLGSHYEVLNEQAAAELAFFEENGMSDLIGEGLATCNELVSRINTLFVAYIRETWVPVTVFKLNQEHQQLQFLSACLGLPEAGPDLNEKDLDDVRSRAVAAASEALGSSLPAMLQAFGAMLSELRSELVGLVPSEQTLLPEELEGRWFGLSDAVMSVCARACEEQERFWEREVRSVLTKRHQQPAWPSAEGVAVMEHQSLFQLSRFSHFIEGAMSCLSGILKGEQRESIVSAVDTFLGRFFDELLPQPCVTICPRLSCQQATIEVKCNTEALADTIILVFLRHGAALVRQGLMPALEEVAQGVAGRDWQEACSGERDALKGRIADVEAATAAVRRLMVEPNSKLLSDPNEAEPRADGGEEEEKEQKEEEAQQSADAEEAAEGRGGEDGKSSRDVEVRLRTRDLLEVSTAQCLVDGAGASSAVMVAGRESVVRVTARDKAGRALEGGRLPFRVCVYGDEAEEPLVVADTAHVEGAVYEARLTVQGGAATSVSGTLSVELYSSPVAGSPFAVTLTQASPADCVVEGPGLLHAEPGEPSQFEIVARSSTGAVIQRPELKFAVSVQPTGAPPGSPARLSKTRGAQQPPKPPHLLKEDEKIECDTSVAYASDVKKYTGAYTIGKDERITEVSVSVTLYGAHVSRSPFTVPVKLKPLHMVPGVVHDFPLSKLSEWRLCYDVPYNHATMESAFPSSGEWIFVAAIMEGSDTIALGAFAERTAVTQDHTKSDNVAFPHHGAYWYWRPHRAVGFASKQQISLNHADTCDEAPEDRLSWHFQQSGNGGWRVGDIKGLEKNAGPWRKHIYVWPA